MDETTTNENHRLKVQIADLTRRLKNAQLTIDAERTIAENAVAKADEYRLQIDQLSYMLGLESAKSFNIETKNMQFMESKRYEENKEKAGNLHQELRMEEVEFWMTKNKREPLKLQRLRAKAAKLEQEQESQRKLLQEIADMNTLNEKLATAAQLGHAEEFSSLLSSGAWINYVDAAGYLPIHYACANGFYEIVKLCLDAGSDHSSFLTGHAPVVVAAAKGRAEIVDLLISFGADVEDKGTGRCPALIAALTNGHFETFAYFLNETNADINAFDANENTALHIAARLPDQNQSIQTILFLLEKGASTERVNRKGHTALQVALYDENKPAAHALGGTFANQEITENNNMSDTHYMSDKNKTLATTMQSTKTTQLTDGNKDMNGTNPVTPNRKLLATSGTTQPSTKGNTTRTINPHSIQYLPRTLDPLPRLPLNSTPQGYSIKLLRQLRESHSQQQHAQTTTAEGTDGVHSPNVNTEPTRRRLSSMSQKVSAKVRPVPIVSTHLLKLPTRTSSEAGSGIHVPDPSDYEMPSEPEAVPHLHEVDIFEAHTASAGVVVAHRDSLNGSLLSGDSGAIPGLDAAVLAGALDSQSVISAVTFGTMKFDIA